MRYFLVGTRKYHITTKEKNEHDKKKCKKFPRPEDKMKMSAAICGYLTPPRNQRFRSSHKGRTIVTDQVCRIYQSDIEIHFSNCFINSGNTLNMSPTIPKSAVSNIGAFSSVFIAIIFPLSCIPTRCWIAPEIPQAI